MRTSSPGTGTADGTAAAEVSACPVLQPAVAEAARRAGAAEVGLVDAGRGVAAALNLELDRVLTTYSDGRTLGDPDAADRLVCRVRAGRGVPATPVPPVRARLRVEEDVLAVLPETLDAVPEGVLPVVLTTWVLSQWRPSLRPGLLQVLRAAGRPLAWVSVEGVGVAPSVPTLGDRPASGHSLVGLALVDGSAASVGRVDTVARCWSRGRVLAWLAGPSPREAAPP